MVLVSVGWERRRIIVRSQVQKEGFMTCINICLSGSVIYKNTVAIWKIRSTYRLRFLILPVDRNAGALPRQTWIDFCTVLASVLHRNPPQEPAKDETAPLRPITLRRPSQRLNHQLLKSKTQNSKEP